MEKNRLLIRFRKEGDLRFIGHRDLARTFERLCRRLELPLAMSEGFHPHPKINFPSALAVGVEGFDEYVEINLHEPVDVTSIQTRLPGQLPEGLTITDIRLLENNAAKIRVAMVEYAVTISDAIRDDVAQRIATFLSQDTYLIERTNRRGTKQVDIRRGVHDLTLTNNQLLMRLETTQDYNVKPQEVLSALGIADIETQCGSLQRTRVHLAS